jgi:hypothetical protein
MRCRYQLQYQVVAIIDPENSGRLTGPPSHLIEYVVYGAFAAANSYNPPTEYLHPFAFAASSEQDILYYHGSMVAHDKENFIIAIEQEIQGQTANGNWEIVNRKSLPSTCRVLPAVWAMRRKRRILDGMTYKWNARLNINGGKQVQGIDYYYTFTTFHCNNQEMGTATIRFCSNVPTSPCPGRVIHGLTKRLQGKCRLHITCIKIDKKCVWPETGWKSLEQFLVKGLKEIGFIQSKHDMCLLWREAVIIEIYMDDTVVAAIDNV